MNDDLYFLTDNGGEYKYLMKHNTSSGEQQKLAEEPWDMMYANVSYQGKYRVIGVNEDAQTKVKVTNLETGQALDLKGAIAGDVTSASINRNEDLMVLYSGASNSTSNLYVYRFADGSVKQLSETMNPEITPTDLVAGQVVRYPSFDDLKIPALLYKPQQASPDNKVPAIVLVHGGPGGQSRLNYSALTQYLVNQGYAVLAVNNRGSSGYGKTFYSLDNRNHGEGDLMDCVKGKDYLAGLEYIDADKIGIMGGSYGGYMTMAALCFQPEAFQVGVNLYGVTNWPRTLKSIPPWWESFKDALYKEMGDPYAEEDSVRLYNISPLFHADKVVKPVMVLQGAKDPRVLQVESDEMVAAIQEKGVPVEYVLFDDEGHGLAKKENQIEAYQKILSFLNRYLKGQAA